jgi:hypothetical protein
MIYLFINLLFVLLYSVAIKYVFRFSLKRLFLVQIMTLKLDCIFDEKVQTRVAIGDTNIWSCTFAEQMYLPTAKCSFQNLKWKILKFDKWIQASSWK